MNDKKRIWIKDIPLPVAGALEEHLGLFFALTSQDPDLVIASDSSAISHTCPVMAIACDKPLRLGDILRQAEQHLNNPVFYLHDISVGGFVFKPQDRVLLDAAGNEIELTDREVDVIAYLARHRGRQVPRVELLQSVWRYQKDVDTHTVETHIYRLRQKIGAGSERFLVTDDGGYRLGEVI